jgi:predicted dinucleotide-binding enzyme
LASWELALAGKTKRKVMKIAILGTGMVGSTLATRLVQTGHQIMMGSRTAKSDAGQQWQQSVGGKGQIGTFADAAAFGEIVFDCTNGANSLAALRQAGAASLRGKILVQVGNPLDFSRGMPPSLTVCNTDSQGEQTQREFPDTRVVKALNTVNCEIMVEPGRVPGDHNLIICGNDAAAKREVADRLAEWFGWKPANIIDLGDITSSRGTEMFLALWIRLFGQFGSPHFNIHVVRGK